MAQTGAPKVLTQTELSVFRKDFDAVDADKTGSLACSEISALLEQQLRRPVTTEEAEGFLEQFDLDHDGLISFEEYMAFICGGEWTLDDPPCHDKPLAYMVAIDGSEITVKAFQLAASLMKVYESAISTGDKSKNDRLIIYHCTNSNKLRGKAKCFGGDALMANMEDLVHELQLRNEHEVQCVVEEQGPDMIAHQIKAYADAHADVLVVGQFKDVDIEKPDDDHEQGHLVAKGCKAALIVVKGSSKLALLNKRRFLAIVDGSDISHTAMLKAVQFMRKGDYIKVVYLETRFSAAPGKSLVKKCESWLAENKIKGSCVCIKRDDDEPLSIADQIHAFGTPDSPVKGNFHVVVMGSIGLSQDLPPEGTVAREEFIKGQHGAEEQGSLALEILIREQHSHVMIVTVDALVSGRDAVASPPIKAWFNGESRQRGEPGYARSGYL